ncbi:peptidylprolyl isomerase [Marinimicrobium sp. ABcell2]|uniref:peptidylprolyl isomerase n=1 Tax=Marinimicrobium sp. ABcell2 TaxID=3069751 RepID=UPI0027B48546|nr:peptidylprolyl isomerase [Marinimicrobium sp. ABcell2]MDQ2077591.1 peptidylprolyl isomerase [Marinimicrobium sp. ABcell2]
MSRMKPLLFCLVLCLPFGGPAVWAQTERLDRIVAIVDSDVVLESELQQRYQVVMERLSQSGNRQQLPPEDVLKKQILDQLILESLQIQMGRRYGIELTEQQLNMAIQNIMRSNQMTEEDLRRDLALRGETMEQFRAQIQTEMAVNQIQQAVVNSRLQINDRDIDSFLASTDGKFATSPEYRLGHILIAVPSGADAEVVAQAQEKAEGLQAELIEGADFEQMAITHSNDPNALQGGELGWRRLEQLPELFSEPVSRLRAGQVTAPLRSGAGFHILKAHETRSRRDDSIIEQTRARHILIKTSELIDDAAAERRLSDIRQRILDGEDFAALAREHSEDIGSMLQGGDLGWSNPGQMVPAFEQVMAQSEPGDISEPFQSRFGWHILQVQERRKKDMSDVMLRNEAAEMLRERRFDEELQTWLAEIREEAYIEVKL